MIIRFQENIRGEQVFASGLADAEFAQGKPFSVMIAQGKGELFFKKIGGEWHESIMSVDHCFGVMKSRPRKLNIAAR